MMFACDLYENSGTKRYFTMPKITTQDIEHIVKLLNENHHIYELIPNNVPIKFYVKTELKQFRYKNYAEIKTPDDIREMDLVVYASFVELMLECMIACYGINVKTTDVCHLNHCCAKKFEFHTIINGIYAENINEARYFANFVSNYTHKKLKKQFPQLFFNSEKIVNMNVYDNDELMLMSGQSKIANNDNILQLMENGTNVYRSFITYSNDANIRIVTLASRILHDNPIASVRKVINAPPTLPESAKIVCPDVLNEPTNQLVKKRNKEVLSADEAKQQAEIKKQQAEIKKQQAEIKKQQAEVKKQQAEVKKQQAEVKEQQAIFAKQGINNKRAKDLEQYLAIKNISHNEFLINSKFIECNYTKNAVSDRLILENKKYVFLKFINDNIADTLQSLLFNEYWLNKHRNFITNVFYEKNTKIIDDKFKEFTEKYDIYEKTREMTTYVLALNEILKFNGSYDIETEFDRETMLSAQKYLFDNCDKLKLIFKSDVIFPNMICYDNKPCSIYNKFAYEIIHIIYSKFNGCALHTSNHVNKRNMHDTKYALRGINWNIAIRKLSTPQLDAVIVNEYKYRDTLKINKSSQPTITEIHLTTDILQRNPLIMQNLCNITTNFPININDTCKIIIRVESGENMPETEIPKISKYKKCIIPPILKKNVWEKWIGVGVLNGKCFCCKKADLTHDKFVCGHVVAEACGGELSVENLRPICKPCNSSMKMENMFEYARRHGYV